MKDVIFSNGSELNRLNFQGFYTILLEKNDELITVAAVRIHGDKVAEIPLVGTRVQFRQLGMCRILMDVIEKKLMELGVQRLILPAVPGVLNTWTRSFGFSKMTGSERLQFVDYTFLDFQDTVMCQKLLMKSPSPQSSPLEEIQDVVYGSGESIDPRDSSPVPEVLKTGQNEDGGIMEQGPVDVAASNISDGIKRPVHQVVVVNQPNHLECEPCNGKINGSLVEDSTFKKESRVGENGSGILKRGRGSGNEGGLKCYQRRSRVARQN
ncbi:FINGER TRANSCRIPTION FACTOR putative-RELATED [Salix koriyanagi]|uniref:FINGER TRANSCRIPTION FACTOR putative-RELATED n=1 Tax=Salix koriyanagi TaxID=2511006 RepID=A0A9Q0YZZ1_9ROSI|nr:FINGER TRANSCRIPTION FACTOR putative-RELATED [Salix koriyanagi]